MGVGMRITPELSEQLVTGVLHLWQRLGALDASLELEKPARTPFVAGDHNVHYLNAETSGMFVPEVEHWIGLHRGQRLGVIVSPHGGEVLSEVRSPVDGVLFTLRSRSTRIADGAHHGSRGVMSTSSLLRMSAARRLRDSLRFRRPDARPRLALVAGLPATK
jgi:predicted deacylase